MITSTTLTVLHDEQRSILSTLDSSQYSNNNNTAITLSLQNSPKLARDDFHVEYLPRENRMSACLLLKDDVDILNEWIAYHYHTVNLRLLVVAIDPTSTQSPAAVFQKWSNMTDLRIRVWNDEDFMPQTFLDHGLQLRLAVNAKSSKWHFGHEDEETVREDNLRIETHRYRQRIFVGKCFQYIKNRNERWAMHIDTDEYLNINPLSKNRDSNPRGIPPVANIPSLDHRGAIMTVLDQVVRRRDYRKKSNYPCITMPRLLYGSTEANRSLDKFPLPLPFTPKSFETTRWHFHTDYEDIERNAQPKVIVDVSLADDKEMFGQTRKGHVFSIHRPSKILCRKIDNLEFKRTGWYPLSVNHYLGSWERYNSRNDTRRNRRFYDAKANVSAGEDSSTAVWINGFVAVEGLERAMQLLS